MAGVMTIDGKKVNFTDEKNILSVIRNVGIDLPTFCYHSELSIYGACRMCSVETDRGDIVATCSERPKEGMVIYTNTRRIQKYRKTILELLLANHDRDCTACEVTGKCQLQALALRYGLKKIRFENKYKHLPIDNSSPSIRRNPNKCIKCGDCVMVCEEMQGVGALGFIHRGADVQIAPAFGRNLAQSNCVNCGQCRIVCPTGAITIHNESGEVWDLIFDEKTKVVAQIAPAVRVAIGELFGMPAGAVTIGKIAAAMRKMGFDEVYDTGLAADLTIAEEGAEFLEKFTKGEGIPLFTSCCPAWVKFVENKHPDLIHNLSTTRSPQQIFGSVYKESLKYSLENDDRKVALVSVMPCTAKKEEASRPEFAQDGVRDVDVVITTQELALMIKEMGINFESLDDESLDMPFGVASGAGLIFGNSGGVMEAALREILKDKYTKEEFTELFNDVRGMDYVKEATVNYDGTQIKLCIIHGLGNADKIIKEMKAGIRHYDFVEVMTCKGGCISGGGQPVSEIADKETREMRCQGLYNVDKAKQIKKASDNYVMNKLYEGILKDNTHIMHIHR